MLIANESILQPKSGGPGFAQLRLTSFVVEVLNNRSWRE
jgi:hypothetical protein